MINHKKLISIVVPVLNEEDAIPYFYSSLIEYLYTLSSYNFEIIFLDNHSTDKTFIILKDISTKNSFVRVIRFSKNIGYQNSIFTGYLHSRGDAVIQLDVDLQDPLYMISKFINQWENGFDVVYGIRIKRKEGYFISYLRSIFYHLISAVSDDKLPLDAGDFRLCDRKIIEALRVYKVNFPYLRGLIASLGYNQTGIKYERDARIRGYSNFNYYEYIKFALNSLFNQSLFPLRIASIMCIIIFIVSFLGSIIYLLGYNKFGENWPQGFASLIITILIGFGFLSLFIGILGEYLGRCLRIIEGRNNVNIEIEIDNMNF